jgi:tRNA threonylcarbamoyladenosine biosynthesis protein TsaB
VEELNVNVGEMGAFLFCHGPGSILGIRTVAMALRTWQVLAPRPVFAYSSLALVAQALGRPDVSVIADARRDSWHRFQLGDTPQRVATADLTGALVMPENFRHWSALPPNVAQTPYTLADLLRSVANADLFRATDAPDAFLHEEPSYVTWTPQVHRAP